MSFPDFVLSREFTAEVQTALARRRYFTVAAEMIRAGKLELPGALMLGDPTAPPPAGIFEWKPTKPTKTDIDVANYALGKLLYVDKYAGIIKGISLD